MTPAYLLVNIDGNDIHTLSRDLVLVSAEIDMELNEHGWCRLEYRQTPDRRPPIEDLIGREIEVSGVQEDGVKVTLFGGEIYEADLHYEPGGAYRLFLRAATHTIRMDVEPHHRSHPPATFRKLGERQLAHRELSFYGDFEDKEPLTLEVGYLQLGETDFGFLRRVADRFGLGFRSKSDGILFLDHFLDEGSRLEWRTEGSLIEFRLCGRLASHHWNGWTYDRSKAESETLFLSKDEDLFGPAAGLVSSARSQSDKNLWIGYLDRPFVSRSSKAIRNELELESMRHGQSRVYGVGISREARLRRGSKVTIEGPVDFAGDWGVLRVRHRWNPSGYTNEFVVSASTRPLSWKRYEPPRWPGLMPARVVELGEKDHEGFVKVQFPWETTEPWLWVRFLSPYAGQNRGVYFSPEVGDEVMVGFEFGDANRPIIVGSSWNGVETPPCGPVYGDEYRNNDIKRIATKSGNRLVLDDKQGKETVVLATPHHVRVSLFDGGQRLLLQSDGDIHIHAGGTVHMKCAKFLREIG